MVVTIEGVGGPAAGGASAASELRLANPGGGEGDGLSTMSDMAKQALSEIGRLQSGFAANVTPAMQPGPAMDGVRAGAEANPALDQARVLAEQIEQTTKVQTQLVQFVMASSISSSLGQNLNTFLRGQ